MRRLINQRPARAEGIALVLPFVGLLVLYLWASKLRLAANADDKLLPSLAKMGQSIHEYAFTQDLRSGQYLLWSDTWASLKRIGSALLISSGFGLLLALAIGTVPRIRALLGPLLSTVAMIPPLAMLPVLFIVLGPRGDGEDRADRDRRDAVHRARPVAARFRIAAGQLVKAQTLGASTWQLALRVVLPQTLPRLIDVLRLNMGAAWLFLIAAEAIASTGGLGYRIFLVRRYLAMDIILPYVAWITLLAVASDLLLRLIRARAFSWAKPGH